MMHQVLDISALLTLRADQAGTDRVAEILKNAEDEQVSRFGYFI